MWRTKSGPALDTLKGPMLEKAENPTLGRILLAAQAEKVTKPRLFSVAQAESLPSCLLRAG